METTVERKCFVYTEYTKGDENNIYPMSKTEFKLGAYYDHPDGHVNIVILNQHGIEASLDCYRKTNLRFKNNLIELSKYLSDNGLNLFLVNVNDPLTDINKFYSIKYNENKDEILIYPIVSRGKYEKRFIFVAKNEFEKFLV